MRVFVCVCVCDCARVCLCVGESCVCMCTLEREGEGGGRESTCQWECAKISLDIFLCTSCPVILRKATSYSAKFYIYVFTN